MSKRSPEAQPGGAAVRLHPQPTPPSHAPPLLPCRQGRAHEGHHGLLHPCTWVGAELRVVWWGRGTWLGGTPSWLPGMPAGMLLCVLLCVQALKHKNVEVHSSGVDMAVQHGPLLARPSCPPACLRPCLPARLPAHPPACTASPATLSSNWAHLVVCEHPQATSFACLLPPISCPRETNTRWRSSRGAASRAAAELGEPR